jgi:hypothetical protein
MVRTYYSFYGSGALPPDARKEQARLFNSSISGTDVSHNSRASKDGNTTAAMISCTSATDCTSAGIHDGRDGAARSRSGQQQRSSGSTTTSSSSSGTVLIASEAIGMGLNLSIHRIVMSSLTKYDGSEVRMVRPEELKQIAGRAGRYSSSLEFGEVACMDESDVPMLNKLMHKKIPDLEAAGAEM